MSGVTKKTSVPLTNGLMGATGPTCSHNNSLRTCVSHTPTLDIRGPPRGSGHKYRPKDPGDRNFCPGRGRASISYHTGSILTLICYTSTPPLFFSLRWSCATEVVSGFFDGGQHNVALWVGVGGPLRSGQAEVTNTWGRPTTGACNLYELNGY
jgi:hypothetical protein